MMEGSHLYGYGGMPVSYDDGEFIVIRPILLLTKEEICNFLNERNIKWYEDSSNYQDEFLRNRLRHHVIPLLEKECPDLYNKVIQYSSLLHESFDYIRDDSKKYLNDNDNMINIDTFKDLRIALKKDIISLMLEGYNIQKNNAIIEDVLELASSDKGSKDISLKDGYYFIKEYNLLYISKKEEKNIESVSLSLDDVAIFGNKYKFYFSKIIPNNNAKYIKLCYNQLELPLLIRNRNDGDFIALNNGNKKVSRVLIDRKVPKYKRGEVPIVVDNLGNILWIYNYLKSDIVYKQKGNSDIYLVCEVL
jgi:tRNA(Ile)-lysidine synthetase-like protein